jgi:hypothetical protein
MRGLYRASCQPPVQRGREEMVKRMWGEESREERVGER